MTLELLALLFCSATTCGAVYSALRAFRSAQEAKTHAESAMGWAKAEQARALAELEVAARKLARAERDRDAMHAQLDRERR